MKICRHTHHMHSDFSSLGYAQLLYVDESVCKYALCLYIQVGAQGLAWITAGLGLFVGICHNVLQHAHSKGSGRVDGTAIAVYMTHSLWGYSW